MIKRKQSIIFVVLMLGLLTMVGVIGVVKTGEKKLPCLLKKMPLICRKLLCRKAPDRSRMRHLLRGALLCREQRR